VKTEKEKAREILKKRDDARKGLKPDTEKNAIEREEETEEKIADRGLAVGVGMHRT
jgi:hypothetical protein